MTAVRGFVSGELGPAPGRTTPTHGNAAGGSVPRRSIARPLIGYAIAVGTYALVFTLWQAQPVPPYVAVAGVLVAAVCMFPMALWYLRGGTGVPVFEAICLDYLLQFGNPVFLQPNSTIINSNTITFSWDQTFQSLLLVALGVGSLIVAYYGTSFSPLKHHLPRIDLPLDPAGRRRYIVVAVVFGLSISLLLTFGFFPNAGGPFGDIIRLLSAQFTIGIVLLAYPYYRRETRSAGWAYLLYGSVFISVAMGLTIGSLDTALQPLALLFLIRWQVTRRVPIRWLIAAPIVFVVLQGAKGEYRGALYNGDASGIARASYWYQSTTQVLEQTMTGDVRDNIQTLFRHSMTRFDDFHYFEWVNMMSPTYVPYFNGSSYSYFVVTWVPRFVWPDKPPSSDANVTFDVDYQLLQPWQGGSIGIGQISEAYANFGVAGIIIIMALQGIVFAIFDQTFNGPESEGGRAIYLALMVTFLNGIGTLTATIFGALFQNAFASAALVRPFATAWRVTPPAPSWRRVKRELEPPPPPPTSPMATPGPRRSA